MRLSLSALLLATSASVSIYKSSYPKQTCVSEGSIEWRGEEGFDFGGTSGRWALDNQRLIRDGNGTITPSNSKKESQDRSLLFKNLSCRFRKVRNSNPDDPKFITFAAGKPPTCGKRSCRTLHCAGMHQNQAETVRNRPNNRPTSTTHHPHLANPVEPTRPTKYRLVRLLVLRSFNFNIRVALQRSSSSDVFDLAFSPPFPLLFFSLLPFLLCRKITGRHGLCPSLTQSC